MNWVNQVAFINQVHRDRDRVHRFDLFKDSSEIPAILWDCLGFLAVFLSLLLLLLFIFFNVLCFLFFFSIQCVCKQSIEIL